MAAVRGGPGCQRAGGRGRAEWRENTEAKQRYLIDQFVINLLPSSCCLAATRQKVAAFSQAGERSPVSYPEGCGEHGASGQSEERKGQEIIFYPGTVYIQAVSQFGGSMLVTFLT